MPSLRTSTWRIAPLLLGSMTALAQPSTTTAYRCADGRYTDRPCPGGQALAVDDARSPQQQAEARAAAQRERELALKLRQQNEDAEAQARRRPAPVAGVGVGKPPALAASTLARPASHAHASHAKKRQHADHERKREKPTNDRRATDGRLGQY